MTNSKYRYKIRTQTRTITMTMNKLFSKKCTSACHHLKVKLSISIKESGLVRLLSLVS